MSRPYVVVGAGLAGLVCARRLNRAGRSVLVLDSDTRPGGKVKTDIVDGFRLDRGFQVFFDAYPACRNELNLGSLDLRPFEKGAWVWDSRRLHEVKADDEISMLFRPFLPLQDKLRLAAWDRDTKRDPLEDIWAMEDLPAEDMLRQAGFSDVMLDRFLRPFFGGIFLDRKLAFSGQMLRFVWKMLSAGRTCVPALGMEEIPRQVAAELPSSAFRFGVKVKELLTAADGTVQGVRLSDGESIEAAGVVLSVDAHEASRLSGVPTVHGGRGSVNVWFDAPEAPTKEAMLILNGPGHGRVNHVATLSQASRDYAPAGRHLVSATLLGSHDDLDDLTLAAAARYEVGRWLPRQPVESWRPLRVDRIPIAQLPQPPGFRAKLPPVNPKPGLYFAGEFAQHSSLDGACLAAQKAVAAILAPAAKPESEPEAA